MGKKKSQNLYLKYKSRLSHKKEQNNAICSKWMDLKIVILSEVRHRNTNMVTEMWNLKKMVQLNLSYKTEAESQM